MELIYRQEKDRWIAGDRYIRRVLRPIIHRKRSRLSGMEMVVNNFRRGLECKGISYRFNSMPMLIKSSSKVISFGLGSDGVVGLNRHTPVIAAIGFPYPEEFPDLCERYNVKKFLLHSQWVLNFVKSANLYNEDILDLWQAGIDTNEWKPSLNREIKETDVLLYIKVHWDKEAREKDLVEPIKSFLTLHNFSFEEIRYGQYTTSDYKDKLARCKTMIFLSAHESQGLACQECMSFDVPVIAWDPGFWLDPDRLKYGKKFVPATSVPFFDERCGVTFQDSADFENKFVFFFDQVQAERYSPREFIVENLSIEKSTERMLEIYNSI